MIENVSLDYKIIAYALNNKNCAMELVNSISDKYFDSSIRWLYDIIISHFINPEFKEIPTANIVKEYLKKQYGDDDLVAEKLGIFNSIRLISIDVSEFTWHFDKFKKRHNFKLQETCIKSSRDVLMDKKIAKEERIHKVNEIMRGSVVEIDSIYKRESYSAGPLDQSAKERKLYYEEVERNPDIARGILTGLSTFDRITNGLHDGELMIIGGESGGGKSILLHNIAVNAYLGNHNPLLQAPLPDDILSGCNILYFSLEMPKNNQERRIDACMAEVVANEIRDGRLGEEDRNKYFSVLRFQEQYAKKFEIIDMARGVTPREIELKYIETCDKYGIKFDLVIVDYLGLMSPTITVKGASDWYSLGKVSEELHEFARSYKIPVLTASQLNRDKDSSKSINRIARSSMVPQNANIIIQIDSRGEDEHMQFDMSVFIIKLRDGEKTSFILSKDFARMKVKDVTDESFVEDEIDFENETW